MSNPVAGDTVVLTETWTVNGVATDPSTVTLRFRCDPGMQWTVWVYGGAGSIVRTSAGVYTANIQTYGPGPLVAEWIGTGSADKRSVLIQKLDPLP